ncbi:MAG TPA: PTS sugar transporter subunit IIA [Zoogloea sp.]|jgi:PTS system nitrogen regulatory IIA component|nr:PTS sugar transporter subunit IIA [Zoogloea sp.]
MISIADILRPEDILLDLNVSGATALFDEVGQLMQRRHGLPRVRVAEALVQREAFGSTALGQGVAIPHGRLAGLRETHAAYVRPRRPMPFAAPDGKPVSDFIVLLVPERATDTHLGILAGVSALFTDPRFRDALHACDDPDTIRALFASWLTTAA